MSIDSQIDQIPEGWRLYTVDMSIEGRARVMLMGPRHRPHEAADLASAVEPTLAEAIRIARISAVRTYRGWTISQGTWPEPAWSATGPNYDAWTEGEGEWSDNGEKADALTREALIAEIDAWFEGRADPIQAERQKSGAA